MKTLLWLTFGFLVCSGCDSGSGATADPADASGGAGGKAGGGAAGKSTVYDAGPPCSARTENNCDPALDCGCPAGKRCGQLFESLNPWTVRTACIDVGTQSIGASCAVTTQTGADNCGSGAVCLSSGCQKLCHVGNPQSECSSTTVCLAVSGYFADRPGIGACQPTCDPLAQNCSAGQGCFYDTHALIGVCATIQKDPYSGAIGRQGDPCQAANSCERGTACLLLDAKSPTGNRCATYCDPSAADTCSAVGSGLTCRSLDALYPRAGMPTTLGVCSP